MSVANRACGIKQNCERITCRQLANPVTRESILVFLWAKPSSWGRSKVTVEFCGVFIFPKFPGSDLFHPI